MTDNIKSILADIQKYEDNDLKANIKNRLNMNLKMYINSIDNSYFHITSNMNTKEKMRELLT